MPVVSEVDPRNMPTQVPLDYTRLRPARTQREQWRLVLRSAAIAALLGTVFATGTYLGKVVRRHAPTLFGPVSAVREYHVASGTVIYEELPTAARQLLAEPAYFNPFPNRPSALFQDRPARDTHRLLTRAETVNSVLDHGAQAVLAEMQTPDGRRRIVSVRYIPAGSKAQMAGFLIETFDLSGLLPEPQRVYQAFVADLVHALPDGDGFTSELDMPGLNRDFRLFAGELDTGDATHFTIPYEIGNQRGVIDGYLQPDGRTVEIELRDDAIRRMLDTNGVHMRVRDHW